MFKSNSHKLGGRILRIECLESRRMLAADMGNVAVEESTFNDDAISCYSAHCEHPGRASTSLPLVGDIKRDGNVDAADLGILFANFGADDLNAADGDFNENGGIDASDFGVLYANWTGSTPIDPGQLSVVAGDLGGDNRVNAADIGIVFSKIGATDLDTADGDFNANGQIDAVDFGVIFTNWTESTFSDNETAATAEPNVFYWPNFEPEGHSRMLRVNPFYSRNVEIDKLGEWLENNGWTREGPNAVLIPMGAWKEIQTTELYKGDDGLVTVESIADHVRNGMKNWERAREMWVEYLQAIKDAGYEVSLVAMDIEAGVSTRGQKYSPPDGPEITMVEVIEYLYSNEEWAEDLPDLDVEALLAPNPYGPEENREAMVTWNHWAHQKNAEAWTAVFAETAKEFFPDIIVNNYNYSGYEGEPLLFPNGLPRANAPVDGNSSPVLYLFENSGYKTVQDALAAFDVVRGETDEPHTIVPWIAGPQHEGDEGWHVTKENYEELKYELLQRGVPYLLVF